MDLQFIKDNLVVGLVVIGLVLFFAISFYISIASIKKLKASFFNSYPFNMFFPHEGTWSTSYFIVIVILLGIIVYIMIKGQFYMGPA